MSNISNVHNVVTYDPKKSSAFSGQRLAKMTYKTDKDTGIKKESKCVSVPPVTSSMVQENLAILTPAIIQFLQDSQDAIIRGLVDSGAEIIQDKDIDASSIAAYYESESTGGRLTKESIAAWFDSSLADRLTVAFADKLGLSDNATMEEMNRVELAVAIHKDKFTKLAGGKTQYPVEIAEKLERALQLADSDDEIAAKFLARLVKMKEVPTADMLGL